MERFGNQKQWNPDSMIAYPRSSTTPLRGTPPEEGNEQRNLHKTGFGNQAGLARGSGARFMERQTGPAISIAPLMNPPAQCFGVRNCQLKADAESAGVPRG